MLKIWQGTYTGKSALGCPDGYFEYYFEKENVLTDFSRRLIKDCARADVLADNVFEHEWRGTHTANELATGVKNILLAKYNPEAIIDLRFCGDNCIPYLIEASFERDITVIGGRLVDFFNEEMYGLSVDSIYVFNTDELINSRKGYMHTWIYGYDWNEETPEGLVLHSEYRKPSSQRKGLKYPEHALKKYVRIADDCKYPNM